MSDTLDAIQDATFRRARGSTTDSFGPDDRLTGAELVAYLDRRVFAVASTARPDGRPHAAMTSYYRRDECFWLPTVANSVRGNNVAHQPWLSLVVAEGDRGAHTVVVIEGPVELVEPVDVPDDVRALETGSWVGVWIVLRPERIYSYGAPGTRA